jgi:hypothetical protein
MEIKVFKGGAFKDRQHQSTRRLKIPTILGFDKSSMHIVIVNKWIRIINSVDKFKRIRKERKTE